LNLNSPALAAPPPSLCLNLSNSPDLSPISVTSSLLTPTDLSPAKNVDTKFAYEFHPSEPSAQGLMLDAGVPHFSDDPYASLSSHFQSSHVSSAYPQLPNAYPFFEPFSDRPSPAPNMQSFPGVVHRVVNRGEPVPSVTWQHDRLPTSSEWLRSDDGVREQGSGIVSDDISTRIGIFQSNFPNLPSAQNAVTANEVRLLTHTETLD